MPRANARRWPCWHTGCSSACGGATWKAFVPTWRCLPMPFLIGAVTASKGHEQQSERGADDMKSVVLALLPNAGLGNKLFVWAKAGVFAHLNRLNSMVIGWTYPKIGPLLRGERSLRMYG